MPYRNDKPDRFTRPPLPARLINERPTPGPTAPRDDLATVAQLAKRMAQRHMPDRMAGCRHCGRTYCDLFLEALAVLDRRDQAAARQIRAVLQTAGLTPPGPGEAGPR